MNGPDKHHMEVVETDDGGYVSCNGCRVGGNGFNFRPEGECPTPWLTRQELLHKVAALREELATVTKQRDERREMVVDVSHKCARSDIRNGELRQHLTATEQRNAELTEALQDLLKGTGNSPGANKRYAKARAALAKPTELGAGE